MKETMKQTVRIIVISTLVALAVHWAFWTPPQPPTCRHSIQQIPYPAVVQTGPTNVAYLQWYACEKCGLLAIKK